MQRCHLFHLTVCCPALQHSLWWQISFQSAVTVNAELTEKSVSLISWKILWLIEFSCVHDIAHCRHLPSAAETRNSSCCTVSCEYCGAVVCCTCFHEGTRFSWANWEDCCVSQSNDCEAEAENGLMAVKFDTKNYC